ncbi:hypothetical protein LZC94_00280 [Pendulispora albinea]|uniref:Uncharacterized protein n=1 Tax=Pendulispora albinea TaxID=2741071 RepID=A0ABZ2LXR9_9BACT
MRDDTKLKAGTKGEPGAGQGGGAVGAGADPKWKGLDGAPGRDGKAAPIWDLATL